MNKLTISSFNMKTLRKTADDKASWLTKWFTFLAFPTSLQLSFTVLPVNSGKLYM